MCCSGVCLYARVRVCECVCVRVCGECLRAHICMSAYMRAGFGDNDH